MNLQTTAGAGIARCVREVTSELEIQLNKMVSMESDGAEVMKGENKGCTDFTNHDNKKP